MWTNIKTWAVTKLWPVLQHNIILVKLTNILKIGIIWLADVLNWIHDPFAYFTRAASPKYNELLFVKAQKFETDLIANFLEYGVLWNYTKPLYAPIITGDQGLWHGITTTYWAIKYSLTQDADDLLRFKNSVMGMDLHQTIHRESKRRLIRGFRTMTNAERAQYPTPTSWTNGDQKFFTTADNFIVEDSVSNDSASGHLCGIYFSWLYGTPEIKAQCNLLIRGLADELLDNGDSLINADGSKTQYGEMAQGVLADPLRLSGLLAIYKVAFTVTSDPKYQTRYEELYKRYGSLVFYPKLKLWWFDNDQDNHRAAIHLSILADLEQDNGGFKRGLKRVWQMSRKQMNIWVAYLNARHNSLELHGSQRCKDILLEFTLEDKQYDTQKVNSTNTAYNEANGIKLFQWGGHLRCSQPYPKHMMGAQDFDFQRNLNSVDNYIGQTSPSQQFPGTDFLVSYILGRKLGLISDKE